MAKRAGEQNMSAAIRDYLKDNPAAKPKAISEGLAKAGVKVTPGYVSTVLSNARKKTGKSAKRGRKRGRGGRPAAGGGDVYANLVKAKQLVDQFGSVEKARAALDTLAKILS
jgi:hypothetical protein